MCVIGGHERDGQIHLFVRKRSISSNWMVFLGVKKALERGYRAGGIWHLLAAVAFGSWACSAAPCYVYMMSMLRGWESLFGIFKICFHQMIQEHQALSEIIGTGSCICMIFIKGDENRAALQLRYRGLQNSLYLPYFIIADNPLMDLIL